MHFTCEGEPESAELNDIVVFARVVEAGSFCAGEL
jgi:hypothetical protein